MFDRISYAAEKLATNVSESRRGFLMQAGQAALSVTGALVGMLALSAEAKAGTRHGYCAAAMTRGGAFHTGYCVDSVVCLEGLVLDQCKGVVKTIHRRSNCSLTYDTYYPCSF